MANRHKPLPAHVRVARAADAALARHLGWEKWPLARQLAYIFSPEGNTTFLTRVEAHSVLGELHQ